LTDLPNNSVAYSLKHVGEQLYHDSKRRGEQNDQALILMGGAMCFIGATMAIGAFRRLMDSRSRGHVLGGHGRGR
jgi:hypothetical protein